MIKPKNSRHVIPIHPRKSDKHKHQMSVVILAANMGYRVKSYGPKCLLEDNNGITLLNLQINNIKAIYPEAEILITIGFEADKVLKQIPNDIRVIENQLYEDTNTVEEIRLVLNNILNGNVLLIQDDIMFNANTLKKITKFGSTIIIDNNDNIPSENVGVTVVNNKATIFSYGLPTKWGQIVYLQDRDLIAFKKICSDRSKSKLYLYEVLNILLETEHILHCLEPKDMKISKIIPSEGL